MERLLTGEKVKEQLKFENLLPKEKEAPEIIPIRTDGLQPRKMEELLPDIDILPDTYIIYPTGGYHPFYGIPNTFPRYQLPVWPYIKRINYVCPHGRSQGLKKNMPNHNNSQANPFLGANDYIFISLKRIAYRTSYSTRDKKSTRVSKDTLQRFHRLVALAWIPNPEKKKNACHINDDATNYLIENLKWGTLSENSRGKIRKRPDTLKQRYLNLVKSGVIKG